MKMYNNKTAMAFIICILLPLTAKAQSTLRVIAVDEVTALKNTRIKIKDTRLRTDNTGEVKFKLSPGKYTVEGPKSRTEGWVFESKETLAVVQSANIVLKSDKVNFGKYNYAGGEFKLQLRYDTPFNYKVQLKAIGVPSDWRISFDSAQVRPDSKTKVNIKVPEGSKSESETIQFLAIYKGQIISATPPIKLLRGWKHKPYDITKDTVKELMPFSVSLQTSRKQDRNGVSLDSDMDINLKSNLSPRLSGNAKLRFTHGWRPQDKIDSIDMRLANLTYLTGIVNITVGRLDLAPIIQPGEYFGSYLTMGQRRFDGIFLFMPITLFGTAGVDAQGFRLPPAALSGGYFPNFFSFFPDTDKYDNGYFFSEFKMPVMLFNNPLMIAINYAITTDYAYLVYSPLSGNPALSATFEYTYSKNYKVYSEFAVGNVAEISDTTALMMGATAGHLKHFTFGFIDEISIEYQIPLMNSVANPFIGGNGFYPELAEQQQGSWYIKIKSRYDFLEFTAAATNSVGDWTFARPADNSFEPHRTFNLDDIRSANEVEAAGKTLISSAYDKIAFIISVGAKF